MVCFCFFLVQWCLYTHLLYIFIHLASNATMTYSKNLGLLNTTSWLLFRFFLHLTSASCVELLDFWQKKQNKKVNRSHDLPINK